MPGLSMHAVVPPSGPTSLQDKIVMSEPMGEIKEPCTRHPTHPEVWWRLNMFHPVLLMKTLDTIVTGGRIGKY